MNYSPKGEIFVSEPEQCALSQVNINTGTHVLLKAQSIHCSIFFLTLFLKSFEVSLNILHYIFTLTALIQHFVLTKVS